MALRTCVGHDEPRDATVIFDQFNIPSGPVFGVHFKFPPGGDHPFTAGDSIVLLGRRANLDQFREKFGV